MATASCRSKELLRVMCSSVVLRNYSHFAMLSQSSKAHRDRRLRHLALRLSASYTSNATTTGDLQPDEKLVIRNVNGLHELTLPMLSRREKCRFTLQPFEKTVGDLLQHIREEDRAIDKIQVQTEDGDSISTQSSIESLLKSSFYLIINDNRYLVEVDRSISDRLQQTPDVSGDVRNLVASLYRTINLHQFYAIQHRQLRAQQTELLLKLEPLEKMKTELDRRAEKRTRLLSWIGLGLMGTQFGFMARLTWWEYSWDIMEPVTYFVGYGTTIAMFAYYVITRQEYLYPQVKDREALVSVHRNSRGCDFDIAEYNNIRAQLVRVERDMQRLRDPLQVQLDLPPLPRKSLDQ